MGFLAFAALAVIVLPIIMALQKGLEAVSKNTQTKEELKQANTGLGKAWLMFVVIIVIVLLIAALSSCNGTPKSTKKVAADVAYKASLEDGSVEEIDLQNGGIMITGKNCPYAIRHDYYVGNDRLEKESLEFATNDAMRKWLKRFESEEGSEIDTVNEQIRNEKLHYRINYKQHGSGNFSVRLYYHQYTN